MIRPAALKQNDVVGIVAPARKLDKGTLQESIERIKSWGYQVKTGKNLYSTAHSYLSGSDAERWEDFQNMLDDASVKAIICARGGYGTSRILDQLDFRLFQKNPKWICGFSDITALHLKLQKLEIQSIHGTMPVLFPKPESALSVETLRKVLAGEPITINTASNPKNNFGKATGRLVGGNLSLIVDSLGTASEIDTSNKILVIEEVDEYLYKIDRMMVQLKRAKKLQDLAGVVVGHMTDIKETELPFGESVEEIIMNHVREFKYPVGFGFPIGHENPNMAWVVGANATLNITLQQSSLSF
ncbi:MAG TPA: LD-carboxypeptidase [Cyclobacteriaceae bacterium]|nr:LD-carboxypeptidase [Cyclobacteriaceae bacterium]